MRITLIGSGNVATHLGAAFKNAGHYMVQVYSRNAHNAALLAYHIGAEAINDLHQIDSNTDIFIIAVSDDVITTIVRKLAIYDKLIVHTSGTTDLQAIADYTANAGVFYPLQTFSKTREVDFINVPICIEGANENIIQTLKELAQTISNNVYVVDSEKRKILHLCAVFVCNFPNFLYNVAQGFMAVHDMNFNLLRPLILETAQKVQDHLPAEVQTGPAIRNDKKTMDAHLQMLSVMPDMQELYRLLSQGIIKKE